MNLGHEIQGYYNVIPEILSRADSGDIFSFGDLNAIKRLYTAPKPHHGQWHFPCDPRRGCNATFCNCNNCGMLSNGYNCGYTGTMMGHWTCCLNEDKDG